MSKTIDGKATLQKMCADRNISFQDVDQILELYASDKSEEQIEAETQEFPKATLAFASRLLLGLAQK